MIHDPRVDNVLAFFNTTVLLDPLWKRNSWYAPQSPYISARILLNSSNLTQMIIIFIARPTLSSSIYRLGHPDTVTRNLINEMTIIDQFVEGPHVKYTLLEPSRAPLSRLRSTDQLLCNVDYSQQSLIRRPVMVSSVLFQTDSISSCITYAVQAAADDSGRSRPFHRTFAVHTYVCWIRVRYFYLQLRVPVCSRMS